MKEFTEPDIDLQVKVNKWRRTRSEIIKNRSARGTLRHFRASEKKKLMCVVLGKMQTDRTTHKYAADGKTELTNREKNWKLKTSSKTEPIDLTDPFFL